MVFPRSNNCPETWCLNRGRLLLCYPSPLIPRSAETQECQPIYGNVILTPSGSSVPTATQAGSRQRCHCWLLKQSPQPKQLELAHLSAEHMRPHLPFCTHPHVYLHPHPQVRTPTDDLSQGNYQFNQGHTGPDTALHEYKPTHVQQIGPANTPFFPAQEL